MHDDDDLVPIADLARWLRSHLSDLRQIDAATEAVDEIHAIVTTIRADVDRPPQRWYAGPCDECGRDLHAETRFGILTCPNCRRHYDIWTRRNELLARADGYLGTATEIARALTSYGETPVTVHMINGYVRRGRISGHGKNPVRYRLGDVRGVVEAGATRRSRSLV